MEEYEVAQEYLEDLQSENIELLDKIRELQNRINKAIDILSSGSKYIKICIDNDINQMQLAIKVLEGKEVEDE